MLDAIEVEVKHRAVQHIAVIFVDNGEGGRIDHVVDTEHVAECLDEGGFAGAHLAVEREDVAMLVIEMCGVGKTASGFADAID